MGVISATANRQHPKAGATLEQGGEKWKWAARAGRAPRTAPARAGRPGSPGGRRTAGCEWAGVARAACDELLDVATVPDAASVRDVLGYARHSISPRMCRRSLGSLWFRATGGPEPERSNREMPSGDRGDCGNEKKVSFPIGCVFDRSKP